MWDRDCLLGTGIPPLALARAGHPKIPPRNSPDGKFLWDFSVLKEKLLWEPLSHPPPLLPRVPPTFGTPERTRGAVGGYPRGDPSPNPPVPGALSAAVLSSPSAPSPCRCPLGTRGHPRVPGAPSPLQPGPSCGPGAAPARLARAGAAGGARGELAPSGALAPGQPGGSRGRHSWTPGPAGGRPGVLGTAGEGVWGQGAFGGL